MRGRQKFITFWKIIRNIMGLTGLFGSFIFLCALDTPKESIKYVILCLCISILLIIISILIEKLIICRLIKGDIFESQRLLYVYSNNRY